jgi:hypothetical protein
MTIKLYRVTTIVPEFRGHRNVCIKWCITERATPIESPYAELIQDYPADKDDWPEGAIDELFTRSEAEAFAGWLRQNVNDTGNTAIVEKPLPIPRDSWALKAMPFGGSQDFVEIEGVGGWDDPATSPPQLKVVGCFDLRDYEPIDKSIPARHQFCTCYSNRR